jgi:hypothetical protein
MKKISETNKTHSSFNYCLETQDAQKETKSLNANANSISKP